ncbi:MAG: response regulator transcription factor [Verrucomicrobiota bacterium]
MTKERIRILLVDDHVMVRMGLISLLADEPDFEVVGQARNGAEAEELFADQQPDVTLMDGILPDLHGTEVVRRILEQHPSAAMIMVSINETAEDVHLAMSAGARGYVPKSYDQDVIIRAIRVVAAGGRFLPPELELRLRERCATVSLSHRELEVLSLIAKGKANKEVADELKLSGNTVKTHIARILDKLGAPDRTRAVTMAIQRGLLRL